MFAAFIYTECISAGPFKRESGFKFKSVEEVELNGSETPQPLLEQRMNMASAGFLPYKAPAIDSFMKPEEFLALDKQWSVQELAPGKFMFARLFTSGVSNGRPDNPFHQGFIYDFADVEAIVQSTGEMAGLAYARPVDFHTWADWQNPRGDAELEAATLEPHNPPLPSLDSAAWARRAERTFETDTDDSMQILSGFESALRTGTNLGIDSTTVDEFLDWVSLLTHLIPVKTAWTTQFTSIEAAKHFQRTPPKTSIYRSDSYRTRVDESAWAKLVRLVIEAGIHAEIEQLIGELSLALAFDPNSGAQSLAVLPLACCFLDQNLMDQSDLAVMVGVAAGLLHHLDAPTHLQGAQQAESCFAKLEKSSAVIRLLPNGDQIYSKLSGLPLLS
jgi:hypothetical protein